MLWPWPLTYDLEKLIRSGHYHYQCVYQIWEQSIPWFLSYRVYTIAGGGRLRRKTITSPDPSDTGDIIIRAWEHNSWFYYANLNTHDIEIRWEPLLDYSGLFYIHGLTLIPARISDYIHYKVWNEISYSFPNFNSADVEVLEWISNFISHCTAHVIISMQHSRRMTS